MERRTKQKIRIRKNRISKKRGNAGEKRKIQKNTAFYSYMFFDGGGYIFNLCMEMVVAEIYW